MPRPTPLRSVPPHVDPAEVALPDDVGDHGEAVDGPYRLVPYTRLHGSDQNPRQREDDDAEALADSIASMGLLEPLVVTADPIDRDDPDADQHYTLLAGHRRLAALRILDARLADLEAAGPDGDQELADTLAVLVMGVPVLVRDDLQDDRVLAALVENTQRVDLSPLEEARALAALADAGMTQGAIAARIGRTQGHVSKRLTIYRQLNGHLQRALDEGALTVEQAVTLARLPVNVQAGARDRLRAGDAAADVVVDALAAADRMAAKEATKRATGPAVEVNPDALPDDPAPVEEAAVASVNAAADALDRQRAAADADSHNEAVIDPDEVVPVADGLADAVAEPWPTTVPGGVPWQQPVPRAEVVIEAQADLRRWLDGSPDHVARAALLAVLAVAPVSGALDGAGYYRRALQDVWHAAMGPVLEHLRSVPADVPDGQGAIEDELPPAPPALAPADDMPLPTPLPAHRPRVPRLPHETDAVFLAREAAVHAGDVPATDPLADVPMTAAETGAATGPDDEPRGTIPDGVTDEAVEAWAEAGGGPEGWQLLKPGVKTPSVLCPTCGRHARVNKGPVYGRHFLKGGLHPCGASGQPVSGVTVSA